MVDFIDEGDSYSPKDELLMRVNSRLRLVSARPIAINKRQPLPIKQLELLT
jgi:hypothetical protein